MQLSISIKHLESKDLVLKLRNRLSLSKSETLSSLLHSAGHRWWTTEEDLDVLSWLWQPLLNHLRSDESNASSPSRRWVVEDIVNTDTNIRCRKLIEVLLQQDVLGVDVGEDQINLRLISDCASTDDRADNLQHRGDTCASCDHSEVADHVWLISHSALRAANLDSLSDLQGGKVLRDVASWVGLDEEVERAWMVVAGDRGVGADDLFLGYGAVCGGLRQGRGDGDMLADWEAEDGCWVWEGETVATNRLAGFSSGESNGKERGDVHSDIVGDDGLLGEWESLELLLQDWLGGLDYVVVSPYSSHGIDTSRRRCQDTTP